MDIARKKIRVCELKVGDIFWFSWHVVAYSQYVIAIDNGVIKYKNDIGNHCGEMGGRSQRLVYVEGFDPAEKEERLTKYTSPYGAENK